MYYKEAWINGKLCYKITPDGDWITFTTGQYKERVKQLEKQVKNLTLAAVMGSLPDDYWEQRCKLIEKVEEENPCDPNITLFG